MCVFRQSLKRAHLVGLAFSFTQALIYIVHAVGFYFGAWLIENRGLTFVDLFKYVRHNCP